MQFADLQKEMIAAMKAKDKVRKDAISSLVSAAKKVAIDEGCRDDISEDIVTKRVKEMKTVKEQIDACPDDRAELRAEYQARYDIIAEFAPQMMSGEEVENYIRGKFADVVATKNMGQIMKAVMGDLKGKAEGKVINDIVKKLCQ